MISHWRRCLSKHEKVASIRPFPSHAGGCKLSFVYESKEKMHHKQYKFCEKTSAAISYNTLSYQLLRKSGIVHTAVNFFLHRISSLTDRRLREPNLPTVLRRIDH
ncbi:hypothetical protein EOS93_28575 [Rhizobium sp. RMa-01]|nr:hypothetical protein EOS93_28575 [Rhizobium sp. RMa-01]